MIVEQGITVPFLFETSTHKDIFKDLRTPILSENVGSDADIYPKTRLKEVLNQKLMSTITL